MLDRWLTMGREAAGFEVRGLHRGQKWLSSGWIVAADNEGELAELTGNRAQLSKCPGPKQNASSSGEFESHCYQSLSSGNRLVNFTLVRVSAIIGATVSRHFA